MHLDSPVKLVAVVAVGFIIWGIASSVFPPSSPENILWALVLAGVITIGVIIGYVYITKPKNPMQDEIEALAHQGQRNLEAQDKQPKP